MSAKMVKTALRAPVNVTWEMTLKCNLRCAHCLSASGEKAQGELSFLECCRTIDRLADMKVFQVNIGGELFSDAMGDWGTEEGTYAGMVRHNVDTIVAALLDE